MAQKSHSQVSHNRRFATAVFGERQTVRQKVLLPLWVQPGKAQCEHMFSALPLRADIAQQTRHVRFVPIVLQNSQNAVRTISRK